LFYDSTKSDYGISAKIRETTDLTMIFQATKNMRNQNKAVNYVITISKAQYKSIIDIVDYSQRIFFNVWAGKLKIFW